MVKFETKGKDLYIDGQKVLRAWEAFSGLSICVMIFLALLSRLGRAPTFLVPIINPPFADNSRRLGVPKNTDNYRKISRSIEIWRALKMSVLQRNTLIFYALAFSAATFTR